MNIFTNARIVRVGADPGEYSYELEERGSPTFTMRAHVLTEIRRNPRRWALGYVSPESKAKEYGEMLDCLALTPHQWPSRFCVLPEDAPRRPSERQRNAKKPSEDTIAACKWWDQWNANHVGCAVVDNETNGAVHAALKRLQGDERICGFIRSGKAQVWVEATYNDRETGIAVPVKGLIDVVPDCEHPIYGKCLGDLKTTKSAEPRRFARDAFAYGYHVAAALYLDLYTAATGEDRTDFVHIVQESFPPYEPRMPLMASSFVNLGRLIYQDTLALYCRCLKSNNWPSYDQDGRWPITEPESWMLDQGLVYQTLEEPTEAPEPEDVIP